MLKSAGITGACLVTNLANSIIKLGKIPSDWESNYIINLYKRKGDALERGNYHGLKLLNHVMKAIERIIEKIIRDKIAINVLSLLLFIIMLVTLSKEFWTGSPWELLYVDDLVISAEPKTELRNKLHSKSTTDSNAYKSQRNHTKVLVRKAKKQHIRNLLNESARDPGGFWKSLRKREKSIKGKISCVK